MAFTKKDYCPKRCIDSGGFMKAPKTLQQVMDEKKTAEYAQELKEKQASIAAAELIKLEDEGTAAGAPKLKEKHMLELKPGINGKIDWSSLESLTGTRPSVNKYSIGRYSLDEWRNHNYAILDNTRMTESNILNYNGQTVIMSAFGNIDNAQLENNKRLKKNAKDIFRWKVEVEQSCKAIAKEVELLEIARRRVQIVSGVLMLPESITRECLELRSNRVEPDLVLDIPQKELLKEKTVVSEVRETVRTTLLKIEEQLEIDRAAKQRIEYDWSDKVVAYNTEATNLKLSTNSKTLMFRPGATKFSNFTAPVAHWEYHCRQNIENVEAVRQSSEDLRSAVNAILINSGRRLRQQADRTDKALAETIALTSELVTKMEEHLRHTLQALADIEILIFNLNSSIRKTDAAMKLAQTRLDNRNNGRPHDENVRDQPHCGLILEVKIIHETVTSLHTQLNNSETKRKCLLKKRKEVEIDIAAKKKSLNIDRERCGMIRSHYPGASELAGL